MSEFKKLVEQMMSNHRESIDDPDGIGCSEPWSLAFIMQGDIVESSDLIRVDHPSWGVGTLEMINETGDEADIRWDRLSSWTKHSGKISLEEAQRVVVIDSAKYLYDHDLSEEADMTKIDMTADDYNYLMEEFDVPKPSDTILTKQSEFKAGGDKPLSGLDGDGGATNEPHEEDANPSDAPGAPPVASMDEPSRKAKVAQGGGGSGSNQFKKTTSKKSDDSSKDDSSDDNSDNEDEKMKNESLTFEDFDLEGTADTGGDQGYMEHDMDAGEIAVTPEFMEKLLIAAIDAGLDTDKIGMVVDAVSDCCGDDRTLDVADIGEVMSALQGSIDDDGAELGEPAGNEFDGAEQDADLMGSEDDMEECGDMEEGSQEDRQRGRKKHQNRKMDKQRQRGDGGRKPKYRKPRADDSVEEGELPDALKKYQKGKADDTDGDDDKDDVKESRRSRRVRGKKRVDEAWLSSIPGMGMNTPREKTNYDGMSEDDIEIAEIKRLARI